MGRQSECGAAWSLDLALAGSRSGCQRYLQGRLAALPVVQLQAPQALVNARVSAQAASAPVARHVAR